MAVKSITKQHMYRAAKTGQLEQLRDWKDSGAVSEIPSTVGGYSLLLTAAMNGHLELVKWLIAVADRSNEWPS